MEPRALLGFVGSWACSEHSLLCLQGFRLELQNWVWKHS